MKRSPQNPILTRKHIPDVPPELIDATSVFNPGAVRWGAEIILLLRVQTRGRQTKIMVARSADGMSFDVRPELVKIEGMESIRDELHHVYDPRISVIDGVAYVVFAADTDHGCRLLTARTEDFERFEMVAFDEEGDRRNGVLFPEKFDGKFLRLERPNRPPKPGDPASGEVIVLSVSKDMRRWTPTAMVMTGRWRCWDERIGSGPPPVKTREGWLHMYHGVATHFAGVNIYQAGAVLLDLDDPRKVIARTRDNVLEPRELYEMVGQVPNVVFPSGWIIDDLDDEGFAPLDARVRVYYGAADTAVALAVTTIGRLIEECRR